VASKNYPLQPDPKFIQNPPAKTVAQALKNNQSAVDQAKRKCEEALRCLRSRLSTARAEAWTMPDLHSGVRAETGFRSSAWLHKAAPRECSSSYCSFALLRGLRINHRSLRRPHRAAIPRWNEHARQLRSEMSKLQYEST
jgi:hypothetical protein